MTSDQLIEWLERKLDEQGVAKVVPEDETLKDAYQQAFAVRAANEVINARNEEVSIPKDLAERAREMIDGEAMAWDDAVWEITGEHEGHVHD